MAFTEFYLSTSGSSNNLFAGTSIGGSLFADLNGTWDGTSVYTPLSGITTSLSVSVGDWVSIWPTGVLVTPYISQVTAVGVGVNGTVTLSTTLKFGTAPTSGTATRNAYGGGSWADLGILASGGAMASGTVPVATRINVQAGTYASTTTTRTFGLGGTAVLPLWWRGFKTTIGDQDGNSLAVAGTDIPSFTSTTANISLAAGSVHSTYSNIDFVGATTSAGGQVSLVGAAANATFYHCRFRSTGSIMALSVAGVGAVVEGCYISAGSSAAQALKVSSASVIRNCYIGGAVIGALVAGTSISNFVEVVFDSQSGDGVQVTAAAGVMLDRCSFYAQGGYGFNATVSISWAFISACHFEAITGAGKAAVANTLGTNVDTIRCVGNSYYNCTANTAGLGDFPLILDVGTVASSGFANPASDLFGPLATIRAVAKPAVLENMAGNTTYRDNGAQQHQDAGGGLLVNPGMTGGCRG